jgi:hypothetical protein
VGPRRRLARIVGYSGMLADPKALAKEVQTNDSRASGTR